MKKAFLVIALATFVAFVSCNGNKQKIGDADASTQINVPDSKDKINVDTLSEENFVQWTKDSCGIDLNIDNNLWLPAYFKLVPGGFQYSMYAQDPIDNIELMTRDFIQQCLDASVDHIVGPEPKCSTVDEVLEHHIEKVYKNEANPDEGFCYLGEIVYVYDGAKIVTKVNFGQYVKSNNVVYTIVRQ